jgi:hypothetical protein
MGLVLVFDLDQTIVDSSDHSLFDLPDTPENFRALKDRIRSESRLNRNIVTILKRAALLRPSGKVSAICLLTNNSDTFFVSAVDAVLKDIISAEDPEGAIGRYRNPAYLKKDPESITMRDNQGYFFDVIMTRNHSSRPRVKSPPKRFQDVATMMSYLDIPVTLNDVYFFDDVMHDIDNELTSAGLISHSIIISPPFVRNQPDSTYYDIIRRVLTKLEGPKASATPTSGPLTVKRSATLLPATASTTIKSPYGRNRSGAVNNNDPYTSRNNLPPLAAKNLPPLAAIHHTPKKHSSIFGLFPELKRPRNSSSGGRRKSRRKSLKKNCNKTRNRLRK